MNQSRVSPSPVSALSSGPLLPNNELGSAQHNKRRKQLVTVKFTPISSFKLATSYLVNKCDHLQVGRALVGFIILQILTLKSTCGRWTSHCGHRMGKGAQSLT